MDPLKDLDAGLERDVDEALAEGLIFWKEELRRFDAGETLRSSDFVSPLTRQEIIDAIKACE